MGIFKTPRSFETKNFIGRIVVLYPGATVTLFQCDRNGCLTIQKFLDYIYAHVISASSASFVRIFNPIRNSLNSMFKYQLL